DAARNDQLEVIEIGAYVQGKAVRSYGAGDVDADGGNLGCGSFLGPDTGQPCNASGDDAEIAAGTDKGFFELADEFDRAKARLKPPEIEDGIADELAWAVEGNIAATIGFVQLNALSGQEVT